MSFANPLALFGLLLLPLLALLEARAVKRAASALRLLVGARDPHPLLAQGRADSRRTGLLLRLGALAMFVLAGAGPQWGRETVRRQSSGSDLVFVLDVSASMEARDVPPSRLDEARREALGLLDRVEGSRVGVVAFAGDAVRLCPLTLDHAATRLTVESLHRESVTTPGTDLERAIHTAVQMLPAGRREEQAIVLWTDGEDLEGHAEQAVSEAKRAGVRVFAVGVGTPAGDVIPVLDDAGRAIDVKRDESGNVVRSRLDERVLRDLGRTSHGAYFAASRAGGELPRLTAAMGSLARSTHGSRLIERPVSRFPACAVLGALLLVLELARDRRRVAAAARAAAAPGAAAAALLLALLVAHAEPAAAQSDWAKGDKAFREEHWSAAESLYAARAKRGAPPEVRVNLATARAKQGKPQGEQDLAHLTAVLGRAGQMASYNLGTTLGERGDYDRALGELRHALERDPDDADARWNYEYLVQQREKQKEKSQSPKPDPQKPSPSQPGGQGAGQGQGQGKGGGTPPTPPPPGQGSPAPGTPPPGATPQAGQGGAPGMTRQQAEQLLGSLQELERLEKQRASRAQVSRERKGKDW